ncbi:DNA repair protein RecO [Oceaniglobus ichthyenteri]|uniref:DNA repair protein RecO n=1 Tax=Oceaniglobus ichthyenteri TaxID=2136177 RepID=UPI000D35B456|nr:DNA repair protein RecO [Oceaniglobus ichthyenteri]
MIDWRDQGVLLSVLRHGETSAIINVFTPAHGRHAGVVRGGAGRKMAPILQPGAQLDLTWRARLEDHLGAFTVEPLASRAALMADRLPLAGLNAITGLLAFCLPEREPVPQLYAHSIALLDALGDNDDWPLEYLRWEQALLEQTGFALDLTSCAVTGGYDDLAYVSPRTGRAVSRQGAGEWADRLLPLPLCMLGQGTASADELQQGLRTTGHFLHHHLAPSLGNRPLPAARQRLIDLFARHF